MSILYQDVEKNVALEYTRLVKVNTVVIGAGQAGLSMSFCLKQKGIEHVVLEKGKVGEEWRSRRWDAFHLITPNGMTKLPGFEYQGNNPDGFDSRDEVVKFLEEYAKSFNSPIKENTIVKSVFQNKNGFAVKTNKENYEAKNVVVAIGSFHQPLLPTMSKLLPKKIVQLHSSEYKNSQQLPKGSVLVVGAGNSGIQIASDLQRAGRKVYLSLGKIRIVPRRYRGKDFMEWAKLLGVLDRTTDEATPEIKSLTPPALFGTGQTVDLRKLMRDGLNITGRLAGFENNKLTFANDANENIEKGEAALVAFKNTVDTFIAEKGFDVPTEKSHDHEPITHNSITELNAKEIASIIWCTGFKNDYSWLKVPVFDKQNEPIHTKGVSKIPGLYFIGLRWLSKYQSFLLCGIAEDADYLAEQIKNHLGGT